VTAAKTRVVINQHAVSATTYSITQSLICILQQVQITDL